ncbi:MAG: Stealth CR1 domain-containing protein [Oscillospiraceae bacterium]
MDTIDFVLTWVDGNDPEWQAEKRKYKPSSDSDDGINRYLDWENLQYWFRAVEKFAPWVNKIHFVTAGHIPKWLNTNNPKLNIVKHSDYIPSEYLPTFSSHPIELNIHRIKGLSENFVYFNDDTFLNAPVKPENFFKDGKPVDQLIFDIAYPSREQISKIVYNNYELISKYTTKRFLYKNAFSKLFYPFYGLVGLKNYFLLPFQHFTGFYNHHLPISFCKSIYCEMWEKEYDALNETSLRKFRDNADVSPWAIRYLNLSRGNIVPASYNQGKIFAITNSNEKLYKAISKSKYRMICCNDAGEYDDFQKQKQNLINIFDKKLPEKSSFEI